MSAHRRKSGRLAHLYEISKALANFEGLEQTVSAVLALASATLPLRSAILIEATDDRVRMSTWQAEGHTDEGIAKAKAHAQTAYSYLVGATLDGALDPSAQPGGNFIVIPLVVGRRPVFGALQLEGTASLHKSDLVFVNAIANQLAIALDRHRAWQLDIALRERAEEATRMRERILGVVSHDLRNPLATILLNAGALAKARMPEETREHQLKALQRIARAAERMQRLIGDLLDFASIQVGQLAITRTPRDPALLINEALANSEPLAREKHLHLKSEQSRTEAKFATVYCDRDRILQVFSNLIGNALKVTAAGGSIILRVEAHEREVLFAVSDTGPGISGEDLQHLFERHWRSRAPGYSGTGLGLHIAKGIVEAHGGRIWAESTLGQGATLSFTIPALDGDRPVPGTDPNSTGHRPSERISSIHDAPAPS